MSEPISLGKAEASRQNGKKSHGPKTPEGKARSRLNAVKHGITAVHRSIVVGNDPEDIEAYQQHHARLQIELAPADLLEELVIVALGDELWRRFRHINPAEQAAIRRNLQRLESTQRDRAAAGIEPLSDDQLSVLRAVRLVLGVRDEPLIRYKIANDRGIVRLMRELERLQKRPRRSVPPEPGADSGERLA